MKYFVTLLSLLFIVSCNKQTKNNIKPDENIISVDSLRDEVLVKTLKIGNDSNSAHFLASYPKTKYNFINNAESNFTQDFLEEFKDIKNNDSLSPQIDFSQHFDIFKKDSNLIAFLYTRTKTIGQDTFKQFATHYFDLKNKKQLGIENIFKDYNIFKKFSIRVKQAVEDSLKSKVFKHRHLSNKEKEAKINELKDIIIKGTKPLAENYKAMVVMPNGDFKIIFDKYAVAPEKYGEISIIIHKEEVQDYLKESFLDLIDDNYLKVKTYKEEEKPIRVDSVGNIDCGKEPCVALTFDDGPSMYTPQLLDILKENDVKVTFFVLGRSAKIQRNTLLRAYQEGHEIENHTWSHKNLIKLNDRQIQQEIEKTDAILEEIIGQKSNYLRPPYGSFNKRVRHIAKKPYILWTVDPLDWKEKNTQAVVERLSQAKPNTILLAHDTHKTTVEAIPQVIKNLKAKGYHFVTIKQLFKGKELKNGEKYRMRKDN